MHCKGGVKKQLDERTIAFDMQHTTPMSQAAVSKRGIVIVRVSRGGVFI